MLKKLIVISVGRNRLLQYNRIRLSQQCPMIATCGWTRSCRAMHENGLSGSSVTFATVERLILHVKGLGLVAAIIRNVHCFFEGIGKHVTVLMIQGTLAKGGIIKGN